MGTIRSNCNPGGTLARPALSNEIRDAVSLIEHSSSGPLSAKSLADAVGCPMQPLARQFTRQMGMSIHAYLTQCRLQRASKLITEGYKIEAIALEVGYRSKKNFYRQFKHRFGQTPATYRNRAPI